MQAVSPTNVITGQNIEVFIYLECCLTPRISGASAAGVRLHALGM